MFDHSDIGDGLNEQQQRALTHEGGPLLVLAGAPPHPVLPVVGPIRVQVDAALGSLWEG